MYLICSHLKSTWIFCSKGQILKSSQNYTGNYHYHPEAL